MDNKKSARQFQQPITFIKMPRAPRIHMDGALYYVTSRGVHGQNIFIDQEDYLMYLDFLGKYKKERPFKLFAYSLLPHHIHLLLQVGSEPSLSEIMQHITSSYTKYFNKKYVRKGHLFRGRFRATLIEKEPYAARLTRYLHRNPIRLNLVSKISEYPYTSYLIYVSPQHKAGSLDMSGEVEEIVSGLGSLSYVDFCEEVVSQDKDLHRGLHRSLALGGEDFQAAVKERLEQASWETQEEPDVAPNRLKLVIPVASGILLAAVAGSFLLQQSRTMKRGAMVEAPVLRDGIINRVVPLEEVQEEIRFELVGLDGSQWQIKFIEGTPFQTVDSLTFQAGKMNSENLSVNGYQPTNYSVSHDGDRLIWETIQSTESGSASWRGEVENGLMRGILSLRPVETHGRQNSAKPQDFSFVSLKYKKIARQF